MHGNRTEGQALLEALAWTGVIVIFLVACGGISRLLYSRYRQVLRSGAGYTAPSFSPFR